ncbi:hypothetical protein C8J56DRAFT_716644, partial [Mycena floridula]
GNSPLETTGSLKNFSSSLDSTHNITVPMLMMNGRYDWSDEAVEPLFLAIPNVKRVTFSNSSHLLHFDEKERFMKTVSRW